MSCNNKRAELFYHPGDTFERVFHWRSKDSIIVLDNISAKAQITLPGYALSRQPLKEENIILNEDCFVDSENGDVYLSLLADTTNQLDKRIYALRIQLLFDNGHTYSTQWMLLKAC
jgi:hypothetical protein